MNRDYLNIAADYFPVSDEDGLPAFREHQQEVIARIIAAFDAGKRFVVLESPTGTGKSVIAMAVARYLGTAYFITPQKILQDQYVRDFERFGMRIIKGRNNYVCDEYPDLRADKAPCIAGPSNCEVCAYRTAKEKAVRAEFTVFNPYYYLLETSGASSPFGRRELIVADEAHRLESVLMSHYSLRLSLDIMETAGLDLMIPDFGDKLGDWLEWLDELFGRAQKGMRDVQKEISNIEWGKDLKALAKLIPRENLLWNMILKLEAILEAPDDESWVIDKKGQKSLSGNWTDERTVEIKPIVVDGFGHLLFALGDRALLMSATILDAELVCDSLGIDFDGVEVLNVPSTFPVKNRPIYVEPVGRMSYRFIDETLAKLAEKVGEILDNHPEDKGIVHCVSYKIQQYLVENIDDGGRFIAHGSRDREKALARHLKSSEPTVLLSPSMTEGLDLADDASRFQIICKIPYPPLNDPQVKARMNREPEWYQQQTALALVQAYGRSVRSPDDFAATYVLDANFSQFYEHNRTRLPEWFREALTA
ncbi:MAG: ATP-dependent DNA helicase [bacterium]|nr:ATP-dependent DNA helicase [bacterium]